MECKTLLYLVFLCLTVVNFALAIHNGREKRNHKKNALVKKKIGFKHYEAQPKVKLEYGPTIVGAINKTYDEKKVYYSFKRIPYAEPPVGNLRFKPPVPLSDNSKKVLDGTKDALPCVQSAILPTAVIGSEDCLYINIYTPRLPGQNASLLPVMVWIFGGAFVVGDGTYNSYGPDYFLDEGRVLVVTFNYRVGIFGFLSTEDDASPGNYGLKDQLLALKWVKANIRSFGGNPDRVTIFGESAGSVSVSYLTQSPLSQGLFHGAILESGTTLNLWGLTRNPRSMAVATAIFLGVDTSSSKAIVEGLRKIDYNRLQITEQISDYGQLLINNPINGLPFGPTFEPADPGAIVVNRSHDQLLNGLFHHVPYVIGYNSLESLPFVDVLNFIRWYLLKYDFGPTALVPASMNIYNPVVKDKVNFEIKSRYFGLTPVALSEKKLLKFTTETEFNRPIIEATRLYSRKSPVYMYDFSYKGSGNKNQLGVGHAEELLYLWRISAIDVHPTEVDIITRKRMVRMWTNFAVTGNPTPVDDPLLENQRWPLTNKAGEGNLAYFDINKNLTGRKNPDWTEFMFWQKLFNEYGNPPYSTY